jgi:hypothetical protein
MRPTELFLSHSSRDGAVASEIAEVLRDHAIPVFFAPHDIAGARQWQDEILSALERCDWFAVLLSPAAVESMWVKREVSYALSQQRYENRIVPLLYQDCVLGSLGWLELFQRIDMRSDLRDGCRELLRSWGIGFKDASLG